MKNIDLLKLFKFKESSKKITVLTCYDATFSNTISDAKIDAILVGDSLGNTIQGHETTVPVTIEDLIYHTKCVANGNNHCFIIADMPFMSYYEDNLAMENAKKLMQAGANMIKLEGGTNLLPLISKLNQHGIPVCAHIGLTPQHVNISGHKVQGKLEKDKQEIKNTALALEEAGVKMLVIECVPEDLAEDITNSIKIPTIGIGAGPNTHGQVLVLYVILGLFGKYNKKSFKFSKVFLDKEHPTISSAIEYYRDSVENRTFPAKENCF